MARINKRALTKLEIVQEASRQFLEKGYSHTTISSISKALDMSPGNLTFHFPTKEHLLAELVELMCAFQWKRMEAEADEGYSSIMAICLELTSMASAAEDDEVIKDFFISAYTSPLCLDIIRRNDAKRAKDVFGAYRPEWTDEQFNGAEILCTGIEYATMMTAGAPVSLETRIQGALHTIMSIYNIPVEMQQAKMKKVFSMDYRNLGKRVLREFKEYVDQANEQAFYELLNR